MIIESALAIGGLLVPPAFDFIKKMFLDDDEDSPEATMSSLATTKPEILPEYTASIAKHLEAKVKWFNRDVIGSPSQWVIDLRASIRPIAVVASIALFAVEMNSSLQLDLATRGALIVNMTSWFGSRLVKD